LFVEPLDQMIEIIAVPKFEIIDQYLAMSYVSSRLYKSFGGRLLLNHAKPPVRSM
jgi:hypothetical protein